MQSALQFLLQRKFTKKEIMERIKELELKFPNLKINKKFQVNKDTLIKKTKLESFDLKHHNFEFNLILTEMEKHKDKYPQFDKIYLYQDRNNFNIVFDLFGEMKETTDQYKERIESETEQREYIDLVFEEEKKRIQDL